MRPGRRGHLPPGFGTIWSSVAIDLVGFGIVLPILPIYAKRFHASSLQAALLLTAFSAAGFVAAPLWGRLSDRYGRRPVILVSLAGTALGSLLTGAAGGLPLLYAGRLIDGASGASVSVAQAAAADLAGGDAERRSRLFGLLGAAFGIGFVAGPAIGALAALAGPRVPFFVAAGLAALNTVAAIRRLPETRPSDTRPSDTRPSDTAPSDTAPSDPAPSDFRPSDPGSPEAGGADRPGRAGARWRDLPLAAIGPLLLVAFAAMVAFSGFEATFSLFGQRRLNLGIGSAALVFTLVGLVIVAVQATIVRRAVVRLGEGRTLASGLVLNIAGLALLATAQSWAAAAPALLLLTAGQGLVQTTMAAALADRAGSGRRGQVLGAQQSVSALARIAGPAAGGALLGARASGAAYVFGAAVTAVALIALVWTFRYGPIGDPDISI
ncbi:MAG TPA: MFS transporter [Acidimicrobiales bacterium]|jgi:MFS family permease|nr:MFS transporter [Acidimicrobiales bacterium]